jgi:tetratricopeptide (TPR) repeat protein
VARKIASGQGRLGPLLREYRAAANLTQQELAERCGLSVQAIGALERGDRLFPRPFTVDLLAEALELDARQRERLIAAARRQPAPEAPSDQLAGAAALLASLPLDSLPAHAVLPAGSHVPLAPNPLFVGRGDELLQIARALRGGDLMALGQVVASTGLGGLGKTQLAVEFVHRYGRYFAGGVFWLNFASEREIPLQVATCAGPGAAAWSLEERVERVKAAWQDAVPRLLVFDNCEEEALLEAWRPTSGGCRVLVTSRRSHWSPTLGVHALPVHPLPRPDSIRLLRHYRQDLAPDQSGLGAIAHELGDLPLALHLAGSYLRAYRDHVSLDHYLSELRQPTLLEHASLLGASLDDSPSPTHHVQSLAQTFALCMGRLDRDRDVDRVAVALLARLACMAPGAAVPRDLLDMTLVEVDALRRADGSRRLGAVGLVEEGEGWLRLHRLVVHFVRREGLDPEAQPAVDRALIDCGEAVERGDWTGSALTAVIPHLVDRASRDAGDELRLAELSSVAGLALRSVGDLPTARPWVQRALDIRERVRGPDHHETAESLDDLASILRDMGDLTAARPLYDRALFIRERERGADHPETAESLNNLAVLLHRQGRLDAARALYERALHIHERALGPYHQYTAESLNNVAGVLREQGDLSTARQLLERALTICEKTVGAEHRTTATTLHNLARLLREQGELSAARPLLERVLTICERDAGPEHPYTARVVGNLAGLLREQGDLSGAERLVRRALAIQEDRLGPVHPETATGLVRLGRLLQEQGDRAAAAPLLVRALAIRERVLGPDHPLTAQTRRHLATLEHLR